MILHFEWIQTVMQCCVDNKTEIECINEGANNTLMSIEDSQFWMNIFIEYVTRHRKLKSSFDNAKYLIQKANKSKKNGGLGKTIDEIAELFVTLITMYWEHSDEVKIYRNGQLYRTISGYTVDLSSPPTGVQTVHFANTFMNENNGQREVVISIDKWQYRMTWSYVPDIWKTMYCAWLKFQNIEIPSDLLMYAKEQIKLSDLWIDFDLDNAKLINM